MTSYPLYPASAEMYWGLLVALYFFYTGLSAGVMLISSLGGVFALKGLERVAKVGAVMALSLLAVAPIHLILDLEKPLKFISLIRHFQFRSAMSWGVYILILYAVALIFYTYYLFKENQINARKFGIAAFVLALAVEGYTGFLMGNIQAHALWNTPLMPVIFLFSGLTSGTALFILVFALFEKMRPASETNRYAGISLMASWLKWFVLVDGALIVIYFIVLWYGHVDQYASAYFLLHQDGLSFIWLENVIGLLIPFLILIYRPLVSKLPALLAASVLLVFGTLVMRINLVIGGQKLPLFGDKLVSYSLSSGEVWTAVVLAAVAAVLITVLMKVLPNEPTRPITSSRGKEVVS